MPIDNPKVGQGPAVKASEQDTHKDMEIGFTHPNLHRRIDPKPPKDTKEVEIRKYNIGIYTTDSYRTTEISFHDEDSETSEIP